MTTVIVQERPDSAEAIRLITELEAHLDPLYPPESRHGFSVERLLGEAVAFFVMRHEGTAAGCGGVKPFESIPPFGEYKEDPLSVFYEKRIA